MGKRVYIPCMVLGKRCAMKERVKNGKFVCVGNHWDFADCLLPLWDAVAALGEMGGQRCGRRDADHVDAGRNNAGGYAADGDAGFGGEHRRGGAGGGDVSTGDDPDIDAAIREELNRILNETAFSYHNDTGRNKGYAGEHRASFTNQTDVDFGTIQLEISLYKLDNPRQYGDDATIPDEPLEVHNAYVGPLAAGETVPLSFTSDTDDYNYFLFGYGYTLEE